jgi:glycosyltransferase involved in cell wall biosynthesis
MKIGFWSPYLDTFGGGERYILTLASHLAKKEEVNIFWNDHSIKAPLSRFLKIDLSNAKFTDNIFEGSTYKKALKSRKYDLIFVLSDGSVPLTLAKKNILHFQVPFIFQNPSKITKLKLKKYQHIVVNSYFTKKFIDKSFNINSQVIYPPVDVKSLYSAKKENIIISVGRFSANQLHPKKQEVLIEVFKELYKKHKDWKLILVGQAKKEDQKYLRKLRKLTSGFAIKIFDNLEQKKLREVYSKAAIYWHATGFGEDEIKSPHRMEHFGISTVEASAAGAVPVVIGMGGQKEIVEHKKNGLIWNTKSQLLEETSSLIQDKNKLQNLSENAIKNSHRFSQEVFFKEYEKIIY